MTVHFFPRGEQSVLHLENLWMSAVQRDNCSLS